MANIYTSICFFITLLAYVNCGTIILTGCVVIHPTTHDFYWPSMLTHLTCNNLVPNNLDLNVVVGVVNGTTTPIMSTTYLPQCELGVIYAYSVYGEMEWGYVGTPDITITGAIVTVDYVTPGSYINGVNLIYYDNLVEDIVQLKLVYYD